MQEEEELPAGWRRFKQTTEKEIDRGWRGLNGSELRKLTADDTDPKKRVGLNRGLHGFKRMTHMIHEELSRSIIGIAMAVLNELKPDLDEKLYERALVIELRQCGHRVEAQRVFPVSYHGQVIGSLTPDLIVDDAIIVDAKVVAAFTDAHIAQMVGYLAITGLELALLLNFKNARLEWKRVVREVKRDSPTPNLQV